MTTCAPAASDTAHCYAGYLLDGSGNAIKTGVHLEMVAGRIAALHTGVRAPRGRNSSGTGTVYRFPAATITPWLADCHVHLGLPATALEKRLHSGTMIQAHAAALVAGGVAAVRDAGAPDDQVQQWCRNMPAALSLLTVQQSGRAWHQPGRYGRLIGLAVPPDRRLSAMATTRKETAEWVKIINSGVNSLTRFAHPTAPQFSLPELQAAVTAVHAQGRRIMVHANGVLPVQTAIAAGCDSIEHGYFMGPDNLARLADRQIAWVPTLAPMAAFLQSDQLPQAQKEIATRTLDHQLDQVYQALRLGVRLLPGTDAGSPGVRHGLALLQELALWQQAGCRLPRLIQAAGMDTAAFLGLKEPGHLAPGLPASFLIFDDAPDHFIQAGRRPVACFHKGCKLPSTPSIRKPHGSQHEP